MKNRILAEEKRPRDTAASSGFDLLFILSAVYGLLLLLHAVEGLQISLPAAVPAAAAPGLLLWIFSRRQGKGLLWGCFGLMLLAGAAALAGSPALREELWAVLSALAGSGETEKQAATGAAVFLTLAATLLVFLMEMGLRTHWPLYFSTTFLLLAVPFLGVDPGIGSVFLFFVFQTAFWMRGGMAGAKRGWITSDRSGRRAARLKAFSAVMLAVVFAAASLTAGGNAELFFDAVYSAEGYLQRVGKQLSGAAADPGNGTVSRGNLYPAGTEQMEVWTDQAPTETLYLRGFSGGDYSGGVWQPADDEGVYALMEENSLHWEQWSSWIPGLLNSLYFVMNASTMRAEPTSPRELWIRQQDNLAGQRYTPYFSMWHYNDGQTPNEYAYQYYELNQMAVNWENTSRSYELTTEWYHETQTAYMREAASVYTRLPEDGLPRLAALCAENPAEGMDEVTAFILSVLHGSAAYTQTPGLFPMNEDPVEYFLFEGQQGYCQHFASAAVLMYRMYGIPARYAAGYAISPSDFVRQEDGYYMAVVTDEAAHAWPEVFLEDYGWVPIEVTPSGDSSLPAYPGMDTSLLEELLSGRNWDLELLEQPETAEDAARTESGAVRNPGFSVSLPDGSVLAQAAPFLLLFAAAGFLIRRMSALREMERMNVRETFAKLLEALDFAGLLAGCDGSEEDFPHRLSRAVPGVTEAEAAELAAIVRQEAFGREPVGEEQAERVRALYRRIVRTVCRGLPAWKRPVFRYGKTFF